MIEVEAVGLFGALLLAAVGVGEGLRRLGWAGESSRRVVHVLVGLTTAAAPFWFESPRGIAVLAAVFVIANGVAVVRGWLPGVHAIERRSWGTATFPLALLVAVALCWDPANGEWWVLHGSVGRDEDRWWIVQIAFLVLALADPAASFVGTRMERPGRYTVAGATKSAAGSLTFAVIAFVATMGGLAWSLPGVPIPYLLTAALTVAALATVAEALGRNGWDNLWIVLAAMLALMWADPPRDLVGEGWIALGLAAAFGWGAWRLGALDLSGALAGSLLAWGLVVQAYAGWWAPAIAFFVLSSALSKWGRRRKAAVEAKSQKGSRRDVAQVLANGGVGMALLGASFVYGAREPLAWAFVASFAAAAADTWGTEIGTWVRGRTRWLGVGREVAPGTSGGMSLAGTGGGALGAVSVALPAAVWVGLPGTALVALVLVAVAASVLDSALGATLQARYRLPDGSLTERSEVDGVALPLAAGVRWLDNDGVNAVCTIAAALAGWAAWLVLG